MLSPEAPSHPLSSVTFRPERLARIAAHEDTHFWHAPRRRLLRAVLRRHLSSGDGPILDAGCGTGALVRALVDEGFDAYGVDPWAGARDLPQDRFTVGALDALPFESGRFAAVCLFDVLEHVSEPTALAELRRVLRPGGRLFVAVPAGRWLWGPRDEAAGHLRRYSRRSLSLALRTSGFDVAELFGFQALLLPVFTAARVWARCRGDVRMLDHEDHPGALTNAILRAVNELEVGLPRALRPPVGSSLIGVFRRRETTVAA